MPTQRGPVEVFSAILITYIIASPTTANGERQRAMAWIGCSGGWVL
jgi:hypothetical protein